jgi:hypothetical protein
VDPKLLYPLKHRGEYSRAHVATVCSREALVSARTQLVNHVREAVKSFGGRLPKCPAVSSVSEKGLDTSATVATMHTCWECGITRSRG